MEILISPIKGCSQLRINHLLTIYQSVDITYFTGSKQGARGNLPDFAGVQKEQIAQ